MSDNLDYWRNPDDSDNKPEVYATHAGHSDYLLNVIGKYADKTASICELGCNCGRNLDALYHAGYTDLTGVEVSNNALRYGALIYPDTFANATIFPMSIEEWEKIETRQYDVIFTMAVLEHIPGDVGFIAEHAKMLITIEDEVSSSWKHYPRDYSAVFPGIVYSEFVTGLPFMSGFVTRVFILSPA